jgi:adenylosuccinate synthase
MKEMTLTREMFMPGKATVVVGGQWGSEGKGKLYSYLYDNFPFDAVVSDFTPNAGHTAWVPGPGDTLPEVKVISKALPIGAHFRQVKNVVLGPHTIMNYAQFEREVQSLGNTRGTEQPHLFISRMLSILRSEDVRREKASLRGISSTMQGGSEALMRKIRREHGRDAELEGVNPDLFSPSVVVGNTSEEVNRLLDQGCRILIETAQGFDLGLNHGYIWPFVTSRDCAVGRVLDNAGISYKRVQSVIGVIRTYPIRVGSLEGSSSGPYYHDQEELTWRQISSICGRTVEERTTVTDRVRRVFSFSRSQLDAFLRFVRPDFLCLNFADYLSGWDRQTCIQGVGMHPFVQELRAQCAKYDCELRWVGFGPRNSEMVEL